MREWYRDWSVNVYGIPSNSPLFSTVEFIEALDVLPAQFEVKYVNVRTHAVRVLRLGKGDKTVLERPTNEYLRRISAVFLREFLQHKIPKLSSNQGSVCLNYDTLRAAIVNNSFLLTEGVELYLIYRG